MPYRLDEPGVQSDVQGHPTLSRDELYSDVPSSPVDDTGSESDENGYDTPFTSPSRSPRKDIALKCSVGKYSKAWQLDGNDASTTGDLEDQRPSLPSATKFPDSERRVHASDGDKDLNDFSDDDAQEPAAAQESDSDERGAPRHETLG